MEECMKLAKAGSCSCASQADASASIPRGCANVAKPWCLKQPGSHPTLTHSHAACVRKTGIQGSPHRALLRFGSLPKAHLRAGDAVELASLETVASLDGQVPWQQNLRGESLRSCSIRSRAGLLPDAEGAARLEDSMNVTYTALEARRKLASSPALSITMHLRQDLSSAGASLATPQGCC